MISKAKEPIDSRPKRLTHTTLTGLSDNPPDPDPLTKPANNCAAYINTALQSLIAIVPAEM